MFACQCAGQDLHQRKDLHVHTNIETESETFVYVHTSTHVAIDVATNDQYEKQECEKKHDNPTCSPALRSLGASRESQLCIFVVLEDILSLGAGTILRKTNAVVAVVGSARSERGSKGGVRRRELNMCKHVYMSIYIYIHV